MPMLNFLTLELQSYVKTFSWASCFFAPKCSYPAHSHEDIAESYLCLSGTISENPAGVYPPGSMIMNQAGRGHAIRTSDTEPVLLTYAWIGEVNSLYGFEMTFTRGRVITRLRK